MRAWVGAWPNRQVNFMADYRRGKPAPLLRLSLAARTPGWANQRLSK